MTYELQKIVAFVLKSQGIKEITESDFVNYISVKKRMVAPQDAKKILEKCISSSVLQKEGNLLKPNFELEDVVLEQGFTITPEILVSEKVDIFVEIVKYISDKSGRERKEVVAEVNQIAEETCTMPVVAALIYAKMIGVDASRFYDAVENEIIKDRKNE
ncbi:MAG: DUF2240 family protein [Thermoplasmata archaeon]